MAKLIFSAITSLDGCTEDEDGNFDRGAPDEEVHSFVNDLERPVGTYLYGTPARPEQYILHVREDTSKRLDLVAFAAESARAIDELGARLGTAAVRIAASQGRWIPRAATTVYVSSIPTADLWRSQPTSRRVSSASSNHASRFPGC